MLLFFLLFPLSIFPQHTSRVIPKFHTTSQKSKTPSPPHKYGNLRHTHTHSCRSEGTHMRHVCTWYWPQHTHAHIHTDSHPLALLAQNRTSMSLNQICLHLPPINPPSLPPSLLPSFPPSLPAVQLLVLRPNPLWADTNDYPLPLSLPPSLTAQCSACEMCNTSSRAARSNTADMERKAAPDEKRAFSLTRSAIMPPTMGNTTRAREPADPNTPMR